MTGDIHGNRGTYRGIMVTRLRSSDGATAMVADHGAHLLSWCPAGATEAIFLSRASGYGAGEAIRGGVPIIFPQFGERGSGKRHGIARIRNWQFVDAVQDGGYAQARWMLQGRLTHAETLVIGARAPTDAISHGHPDTDADAETGGANFLLTFEVRLAGDLLELGLTVTNPLTGISAGTLSTSPSAAASTKPGATLRFHAALHTYLRVRDLAAAGIHGLQGRRYIDQVLQGMQATQSMRTLMLNSEVDRIYPDAPSCLCLQGPEHPLSVEQTGFSDTVVWNPGSDKAAALPDLHAGGYRQFVCIEAATIMRPIALRPGEHWRGMQRLRLAVRP